VVTLPGKSAYRGRRGASPNEWHVLVAWVPTKEHGLVPVGPRRELRRGWGAGVCVRGVEEWKR
jgi:hypothetical protein